MFSSFQLFGIISFSMPSVSSLVSSWLQQLSTIFTEL